MRLFTVKYEDIEDVAVEIRKGKMCLLSSVGIAVRDMNDLICRYDELKDDIRNQINGEECRGVDSSDCAILAPIPVPIKDIICLGVNYRDHTRV